MLTIHTADEGGAVAVEGARVVGVGTLAEVQGRFPGARLRSWPGTLVPARIHEGPLPDAPSPRERIHAVLKLGAVAVLEQYADSPELRSAAERNGVMILPGAHPRPLTDLGRADLAVFDETGECIATVCAGRLVHRRR
ncbi:MULTISPECIES: imidazolonepropionase-like domain-containing protein [unclassified Streptomyces]|uniref:imidazolonepropionase-like domain-containing protein n=1 Tax=unclassified Streptomyces TaxID=2593676 RepID=UPI00403D4FDE